MKRFIRYIYEYVQGKKIRNVGFVKADQDDGETTLHIHGRGMRLEGKSELSLFLIYEKDGKCYGIPRGTLGNINPALNGQLSYSKGDDEVAAHFDDIIGIALKSSSERTFAAVWTDRPVDVETMDRENISQKSLEEDEEAKDTEGDMLSVAAVIKATDSTRENMIFPEKNPSGIQLRKIQRRELSELPRSEWRIANNNFLLHGYHNYRHLALIEEGDKVKVGVPGQYHEKEQKAALAFGFPEFIRTEEDNEDENFGYWCRQISRGYH